MFYRGKKGTLARTSPPHPQPGYLLPHPAPAPPPSLDRVPPCPDTPPPARIRAWYPLPIPPQLGPGQGTPTGCLRSLHRLSGVTSWRHRFLETGFDFLKGHDAHEGSVHKVRSHGQSMTITTSTSNFLTQCFFSQHGRNIPCVSIIVTLGQCIRSKCLTLSHTLKLCVNGVTGWSRLKWRGIMEWN